MKNIPKRGTKEWDLMLEGALAFLNSGLYDQVLGTIPRKKPTDKDNTHQKK